MSGILFGHDKFSLALQIDLVELTVIPFQSMATNVLFKILVGSNKSRFDLLRFGCLKLDNFQLRFLIIDQCGHVV